MLRSFHAPLVLIWQRGVTGPDELRVKRAKMKIVDEERVYEGLDIDKKIPLTETQSKLVLRFWQDVDFDKLPQLSEQEEQITAALDGSSWIYETAVGKSSFLFAKSNPLDFQLNDFPASRERRKGEHYLRLFSVMLWTMAGIEDPDVY